MRRASLLVRESQVDQRHPAVAAGVAQEDAGFIEHRDGFGIAHVRDDVLLQVVVLRMRKSCTVGEGFPATGLQTGS